MDCTIYVAKTKVLISCTVTMQIGADQLHCYHAADLCLCFCICKKQVSYDAAHLTDMPSVQISTSGPGPRGYKTFHAQLSMKLKLLLNVKVVRIKGSLMQVLAILTFISWITFMLYRLES